MSPSCSALSVKQRYFLSVSTRGRIYTANFAVITASRVPLMSPLTRTCKLCQKAFVRERTSRSPFCSEECRHEAVLNVQRNSRTRREAKGVCLYCPTKVEKTKLCPRCIRGHSLANHKRLGFKRFYLGSKHAPERQNWILNDIKFLNPLLAQNWNAVSPWIEKNFELWAEPTETGFYGYFSLDATGKVPTDIEKLLGEAEKERHNGLSFEESVILKIDTERELSRSRRLLEARIA